MPTLNEEAALRRNLPAALAAADEVVVTDGDSRDGSAAVARELGARVVAGPAGRGGQLNRGARAARAEILVFLHADTLLPAGAAEEVRRAVAAGAEAGAFLLRFDNPRRLFRLGAALINARTRLTRLPLGDQAQFFTRRAFEELGGFRDWPILEDLDLMLRVRRRRLKLALLPGPATTAARRYERGVARTIATNWLIWLLFFLGISPERLARLYREIR